MEGEERGFSLLGSLGRCKISLMMQDPGFSGRLPQVHESRDAVDIRCFPQRMPLELQAIRQRLAKPVRFTRSLTLHIFRHGETLRNQLGLITGASDEPLTPMGRQQALSLGYQLEGRYDLAFSSSLSRSRDTLLLAMSSGCVTAREVFTDSRLDERRLGVLEGQPARPLEPYARGELGFAPAHGESYETVALKILSFLIDLAEYSDQSFAQNVVISTHMGPLRILIGVLENDRDPVRVLNRKFDNASVLRMNWCQLCFPPFLR